jgi:hypothetical protein
VTISAANATLNGKQVRTGDCAVAVKFVGTHEMRVVIRASCRTANGAKLGVAIIVAIIIAVAVVVSAAHYYYCCDTCIVEEM